MPLCQHTHVCVCVCIHPAVLRSSSTTTSVTPPSSTPRCPPPPSSPPPPHRSHRRYHRRHPLRKAFSHVSRFRFGKSLELGFQIYTHTGGLSEPAPGALRCTRHSVTRLSYSGPSRTSTPSLKRPYPTAIIAHRIGGWLVAFASVVPANECNTPFVIRPHLCRLCPLPPHHSSQAPHRTLKLR